MPARQRETAEHASQHHDVSNNDQHFLFSSKQPFVSNRPHAGFIKAESEIQID
jgi:hypothetical protein